MSQTQQDVEKDASKRPRWKAALSTAIGAGILGVVFLTLGVLTATSGAIQLGGLVLAVAVVSALVAGYFYLNR